MYDPQDAEMLEDIHGSPHSFAQFFCECLFLVTFLTFSSILYLVIY